MISWLNETALRLLPLVPTWFWQTGVLVGVLFVGERVFRRVLPAAWLSGLWMLVLIRMVVPPGFQSPTSIGYWVVPWLSLAVPVMEADLAPSYPDVGLTPPIRIEHAPSRSPVEQIPVEAAEVTLSWEGWCLLAWAAGVLVILIHWMVRNLEIGRISRNSRDASEDLREIFLEAAGPWRGPLPKVRVTRLNHSPAIYGWIRPVILLPQSLLDRLPRAGLRDVLLHELVHWRRGDLCWGLFQTLIQAVGWWNPWIWLANERIHLWRERAVDDVVRSTSHDRGVQYAETLVEVARYCSGHSGRLPVGAHIGSLRGTLRSRVIRLLDDGIPRRMGLGWQGGGLILLVGSLVVPMAQGRKADQPNDPNLPPVAEGLWKPWSPKSLDAAWAAGNRVLVLVTAKWDSRGKDLRREISESDSLHRLLERTEVVCLEADWTSPDPELRDFLGTVDRRTLPELWWVSNHQGSRPIPLAASASALEEALTVPIPNIPAVFVSLRDPPFTFLGERMDGRVLKQRLQEVRKLGRTNLGIIRRPGASESAVAELKSLYREDGFSLAFEHDKPPTPTNSPAFRPGASPRRTATLDSRFIRVNHQALAKKFEELDDTLDYDEGSEDFLWQLRIREYLRRQGIVFPKVKVLSPQSETSIEGKQFWFDHRSGLLRLTAEPDEIERVRIAFDGLYPQLVRLDVEAYRLTPQALALIPNEQMRMSLAKGSSGWTTTFPMNELQLIRERITRVTEVTDFLPSGGTRWMVLPEVAGRSLISMIPHFGSRPGVVELEVTGLNWRPGGPPREVRRTDLAVGTSFGVLLDSPSPVGSTASPPSGPTLLTITPTFTEPGP